MGSKELVDLALVVLPYRNLTSKLMYFPLGVLYLVAAARRAGFSVGIADMRDKTLALKHIPPARYTGFSATSGEIEDARHLARKLRHGRTTTIIGGAHATLLPEDCQDFDIVLKGEGDHEIVNILNGKRSGVVQAVRIADLDSLPMPAWDAVLPHRIFSTLLFPGEKYGQGELAATVIFSRGCPYSCNFCGNLLRAPVVRLTPDRAASEIIHLKHLYGISYFRLEDDNITLNFDWFKPLMANLAQLNIKFKCHTRPDLFYEDHAVLLKQAGCEEMGFGAESGDDRLLKIINKGFTVADTIRAVQVAKQHGIRAKTYLVAGMPGETQESVELTKQMMLSCRPDRWTLSRFAPYPGSAVYANPGNYGVQIDNHGFSGFWNFYNVPPYRLDNASKAVLTWRYKELYRWLKENMV